MKCEAAMIHNLFFDIMKIAFPETDFGEARSALALFNPTATGAAPSPKPPSSSQSRRHPQMEESRPSSSPTKARGHSSAHQEGRQDFTLAHPADLVICKKRRNDRDKQRVGGPSSPVTPRWMGSPLPPTHQNRGSPARSPITNRSVRAPFQREANMVHPDGSAKGLSPGLKEVQWAKPVKKMRTDSGKRRPSHI